MEHSPNDDTDIVRAIQYRIHWLRLATSVLSMVSLVLALLLLWPYSPADRDIVNVGASDVLLIWWSFSLCFVSVGIAGLDRSSRVWNRLLMAAGITQCIVVILVSIY